jgi:hypothetical protein
MKSQFVVIADPTPIMYGCSGADGSSTAGCTVHGNPLAASIGKSMHVQQREILSA